MYKNIKKSKKIIQKIYLDEDDYANFLNLKSGIYHPRKTYFNRRNYIKFINQKSNQDAIPILLNVDKKFKFKKNDKTKLIFNKKIIGEIQNKEVFKINKNKLIKNIFGFNNNLHPVIEN